MVQPTVLPASDAPLQQGIMGDKNLDHGAQVAASLQTAAATGGTNPGHEIGNGMSLASPRKMADSNDFQIGFANNMSGIDNSGLWYFEDVSNSNQPPDTMQVEYFQTLFNDTQMNAGTDSLLTSHPPFPPSSNLSNMNITQLTVQHPDDLPPTSCFVKLVEDTCIRYSLQLNTIKMVGNGSGRVSDAGKPREPVTAHANQQIPEKVTEDLVKIAVYLITISSKLEKYVYGVVSSIANF
jgi:hypothetical protein